MLFHLGVVYELNRHGHLGAIRCLSSVSGGSIVCAHLALHWEQYTSGPQGFSNAADALIRFAKDDLRGKILRRFYRNPRVVLQGAYRSLFTLDGKRARLPHLGLTSARANVYIMGTNLTEGCPCSFSPSGYSPDASASRLVSVGGKKIDVAYAVTVSSGFPALIPPIPMTDGMLGIRPRSGVAWLSDGGVYDNLGLGPHREMIRRAELDLVIVSNAGSADKLDRFRPWTRIKGLRLLRGTARSYEIAARRVVEHDRAEALKNGFVFVDCGDRAKHSDLPPEVQSRASQIRTDLDLFTNEEISALIHQGQAIARDVLAGVDT